MSEFSWFCVNYRWQVFRHFYDFFAVNFHLNFHVFFWAISDRFSDIFMIFLEKIFVWIFMIFSELSATGFPTFSFLSYPSLSFHGLNWTTSNKFPDISLVVLDDIFVWVFMFLSQLSAIGFPKFVWFFLRKFLSEFSQFFFWIFSYKFSFIL